MLTVIGTNIEPIPGWIDNFNGPIGLTVGCGKGIVRIIYSDPNNTTDFMAVDVTVKAIIISSWKQATYKYIFSLFFRRSYKSVSRDASHRLNPSFYNGSNNDVNNTTIQTLVDLGTKIWKDSPYDNVLWYPNPKITKCYYNYVFQMLMYQLIPALLIDGMLKLMGERPM